MDLNTIDTSSLTQREQMMLFPFYSAYTRKYPTQRTWRQLRSEGFEPIEWQSVGIDECESSLDELDTLSSFEWDDGNIKPRNTDDGITWKERLINKWRRNNKQSSIMKE